MHDALLTWGKKIFIVQAGVSVAVGNWLPVSRFNEFAGFVHLKIDSVGVKALVAETDANRCVLTAVLLLSSLF